MRLGATRGHESDRQNSGGLGIGSGLRRGREAPSGLVYQNAPGGHDTTTPRG
jgi:hypothetical protein